MVWEAKLAAPVTGVWLHSGGRVERVSVAPILDTQSALMMVSYKHQFYIQSVEVQPHSFPGATLGQPHPLSGAIHVDHRAVVHRHMVLSPSLGPQFVLLSNNHFHVK